MNLTRTLATASLALALTACAGARTAPVLMEGKSTEDVVRLTNGEVIKGKVLEENPRQVIVERDERVVTLPRAAVYSIDYAKESWREMNARMSTSEPPPSPRPASSWVARAHPSERVEQNEVLWFDGHPLEDCLGRDLARSHAELPDLRLFAEPGGKILLHDPRRWGYHAHLTPAGFHRPTSTPGLSIPLSPKEAELPTSLAVVSPSQEMKSRDAERSSYTPPDALIAELKPLSVAEGALAAQPFAGGRPVETRNGSLWTFTLPRNSRQFYLYLLDPAKKHGEILKAAFAGYGDTILAPDLILDSVAADGVTVGRVFVLPYPEGVAPDGPAPEALTLYSGPPQDPTRVAAAALPPRLSAQPPLKTASTKATLLLSHFDVSPALPQVSVVAWGTGRPSTTPVSLEAKPLTPREADRLVRIDLSNLPEESFPAVAWFQHRRVYLWRATGGRVEPAAARVPLPDPVKLSKVRKNDPIPHALPLVFTGRKSDVAAASSAPPVSVSGGMSAALLSDSLARGASRAASDAPLAPAPLPAPASAGQVSSVTNVYITAPAHAPSASSYYGGAGNWSPGMHVTHTPGYAGPTPNPWGWGAYGPVQQTETTHDGRAVAPPGALETIYDPVNGTVITIPRRQNR